MTDHENRDRLSIDLGLEDNEKPSSNGELHPRSFNPRDLFMSVARGNLKKLRSVLKRDPSVLYYQDENGFAAFHIAALHSQLEILDFLLDKEQQLEAEDKTRPHDGAEHADKGEVVDVNKAVELLPFGEAQTQLIDMKSNNGWTALLLAASANSPPSRFSKVSKDQIVKCVEFLLKKGADPHVVNNDGTSVCHIAASTNLPEVLRVVIKYNAPVNIVDKNGKKPIDIARQKSFKDCARVLMAGEWGTSDDYFHNEVTKLITLKRYRDELCKELDVISLFEADLQRNANFKDWLQRKGYDGVRDGPPQLSERGPIDGPSEQEVEKTRLDVFGKIDQVITAKSLDKPKVGGKGDKLASADSSSSKPIISISYHPQLSASSPKQPSKSSTVCKICGVDCKHTSNQGSNNRESQSKSAAAATCKEGNVEIELPNLRSALIESVIFGNRQVTRNCYKSDCLLDMQKRKSLNLTNKSDGFLVSDQRQSQLNAILRDIPENFENRNKHRRSSSSNRIQQGTFLNEAAKIPIMWKGKPSTVKDYYLEKVYIC